MCDQCVEIDKRIAHLQNVARRISDPRTVKGLDLLIADLESKKMALHPESKQ